MAQPTIKDVAKLAGVSISTVSRVMNRSKPVSPEAERRVLDAINKLGFKPNELARSLVMKKSNSIGILVKDIGIEYMAQIIRGAEEVGRMYNYDILLSSTYGDLELQKKAVDFLFRKQVEGIIVIEENVPAEILVKIRGYHLPYILLDRFQKGSDHHTVTIDYRQAMYELTKYMLELGNRDILYLRSLSNYDVALQKSAGYRQAMREFEREPIEREVDGDSAEKAFEEFEAFCKADHPTVTGVIAESDALALGVINYCYDHGLSVPGDYDVAGFGGSHIGSLYRPRLTTVVEPYYEFGAIAMRFMTKILQKEQTFDSSVYLPAHIDERESTRRK